MEEEQSIVPKIFEMRLRTEPFEQICKGEKTVEFRLHDKKRALLKAGDQICFTEMEAEETGRKVLTEIEDIITAPSFAELEKKLQERGIKPDASFSPVGMRKYYSEKDEAKYGVMGIKIKVLGMDDGCGRGEEYQAD